MKTTTIDMRPEPFEPPFFYTQLDTIAKNRLKLWQEKRQTLGEGHIFGYCDSGMVMTAEPGEPVESARMRPLSASPMMTRRLEDALHRAKDFIEYHERHADEHGGLNLSDCHEWGNAQQYDGHWPTLSLSYGIRLSFNDGSVRFFVIESKPTDQF